MFYSSTYTHAFKPNTFTNVQTLKDVAYGPHPQQVMDVYFPAKVLTNQTPAPLTMMVHGGAWKIGDKNRAAVVKNKLNYWNKRNWIFVSINY